MTKQILKIKGMHCASCASVITDKLSAMPHINSVSVNYGTEKVKLDFDDTQISIEDINQEIRKLGYALMPHQNRGSGIDNSVIAQESDLDELKNKTEVMIPITFIVFILMIWEILAKTTLWMPALSIPMEILNMILMILATVSLFWVGKPYLLGITRFIQYGVANMDTLIGIGTVASYVYSSLIFLFPPLVSFLRIPHYTYFDVTIVVIGFITLGKYLEIKSKKKTGDAIEKLISLQAKTALVIRNGQEFEISINDILHGDLILVKPGSKIPVDGIITEGASFINESMITGESMPVQKKIGDNVVSGTMNTSGSFIFKATKIGSETLLAQIINMVEEAQGSRAPIQTLVDKISSIFVPFVLIFAFLTLTIWLTVGSYYLGFSQAVSFGLVSFVGVLVIACPCALGLATPTAIIVGVGKGAKEGILIKDAATLEKLHKVNTVVLDKTGTITIGKPTLVNIQNLSNIKDDELVSILASLEKKSEHPIAHAITNYAKEKNISISDVSKFENMRGRGIKGTIKEIEYFVGNEKLISELELPFDGARLNEFTSQGKTPVIIATKEQVMGFIMVADEIKITSIEAIKNLHSLGIKVIMLTGDDQKTAKYIASLVGIDDVIAHVLPQDKLEKIKEIQSQGRIVAMIGDGVNDAPALVQADVGIAMGTGTDVAIESAGITLLGGDILKFVKAINLSKMTMQGIKQNLFWAFIYNIVGIPLAAGLFYPLFGWTLNPIFAGLAMAFSSVSVVANSLRITTKRL